MLGTWLFARETVRQLGGRVCGKRRRRAGPGSELKKVRRALAVPGLGDLGLGGLGTGSGEVVLGEEGSTPENRDGRGLSDGGWQAPERRVVLERKNGRKSWTHKSLLMAEPVEAGVLKILNIDGGHLVHRRVPLLPQAEKRER